MGDLPDPAAAALRLGDGASVRLSAAAAIAKALLQCGVSYIGVESGAECSAIAAPLRENRALLDGLGVAFCESPDPAAIAALVEISAAWPARGALVLDAASGIGRAADALAAALAQDLAAGVLVVLNESEGGGFAAHAMGAVLRGAMPMIDPRQEPDTLARAVERGFRLSEACRSPVLLRLRARGQAPGELICAGNSAPAVSPLRPETTARGPTGTGGEQAATSNRKRLEAARAFIAREGFNEAVPGRLAEAGLIVPGALAAATMRALAQLGVAAGGASELPLLVLNAVIPLDTAALLRFCSPRRAVLVVDDGEPPQLEDAVNAALHRGDNNATFVVGREVFPGEGCYDDRRVLRGVGEFLRVAMPAGVDLGKIDEVLARADGETSGEPFGAATSAGAPLRPGGTCAECPASAVYDALAQAVPRFGPLRVRAGPESRAALAGSGRTEVAAAAGPIDAAARWLERCGGAPAVRIETERDARHSGFAESGPGVLVLVRGGCGERNPCGSDEAALSAWLRGNAAGPVRWADAGDRFALLDALLGALEDRAAGMQVVIADALRAARQLPPRLRARIEASFPCGLAERLAARAARLVDYQDEPYAESYLDRLRAVYAVDREAGGAARGYPLLEETSRLLARWMAYEDPQRLAQMAARFPRLAASGEAPRGSRRELPRHAREQALIERWLGALTRLGFAALDLELALEIARCAELADGRAGSHERGLELLGAILEQTIEGGGAELADAQRLREAIRAARLRAQGVEAPRAAPVPPKSAVTRPMVFMKREIRSAPDSGGVPAG